MTAFFAVPINDWPKNPDGSSALSLNYVSKFICKYYTSHHFRPTSFNPPTVGLSVAIIFPFLIFALTVNGVRDIVHDRKRRLDYDIMDVNSRLKKIWIVIMWVIHPMWHPIYSALLFLIAWIKNFDWDFFKYILEEVITFVPRRVLFSIRRRLVFRRRNEYTDTESLSSVVRARHSQSTSVSEGV
jgi:hypothetical protein